MNLPNQKFDDDGLIALIKFHDINTIVGSIGALISTVTLVVFFSSTEFLRQNKLLALLAAADLCSCIGILALGLMRKALYEQIVMTSQVPLETTWSCASKPFVFLRLIGVIIPPWVLLTISLERFMAVFAANFYRRYISPRTKYVLPSILLYAFVSLITVYIVAWARRNNFVESYCGRRKIFTNFYTIFVFVIDILAYSIALALNGVTCWRLARLQRDYRARGCVQRQVHGLHYMLVISALCALFVAAPNALFLSFILFGKWLPLDLTDPTNWAIALKCSANLAVYVVLKEEFRMRIYEILGCISTDPRRERQYEISALGGDQQVDQNRKVSSLVGPLSQQNAKDSISALADLMINKERRTQSTIEVPVIGRPENVPRRSVP